MNYRDENYIARLADSIWNPQSETAIDEAFNTLSTMRSAFIKSQTGAKLQNSLRFILEVEREVMHTARRAGYFNGE